MIIILQMILKTDIVNFKKVEVRERWLKVFCQDMWRETFPDSPSKAFAHNRVYNLILLSGKTCH